MNYPRSHAAAAVWNGKLIVSGGITSDSEYIAGGITKSVEWFYPECDVWTVLESLPTPFYDHYLTSYGNQLLLMGGSSVLESNPLKEKEKWNPVASMRYPRSQFAGIVLDNEIYAIGGRDQAYSDISQFEIFNGNSWRNGPSLPYKCCGSSSVIIPQHFADLLCKQ